MKYLIISLLINGYFWGNANAQILNSGFEQWDSIYSDDIGEIQSLRNIYNVTDPQRGTPSEWAHFWSQPFGTIRTADAYTGDYALLMHTWYNHSIEQITFKNEIANHPKYLTGHYKFLGDTLNEVASKSIVNIIIKDQDGDTISHNVHYLNATDTYIPFEIELDYHEDNEADSIFIMFQNSTQRCSNLDAICDLLFLDDITFSDNPVAVGIGMITDTKISLISTQISNGILNIRSTEKVQDILIYDLKGILLQHQMSTQIDLSNYPNGFYIIKAVTGLGTIWNKKIMKF